MTLGVIIPGVSPNNRFNTITAGGAYSGTQQATWMCSFKFIGAPGGLSALIAGSHNGSPEHGPYVRYHGSSGTIQARWPFSVSDPAGDLVTLVDPPVADTVYTIFQVLDIPAGELKRYVNGVQVGATVDVTGLETNGVALSPYIRGLTQSGSDTELLESAMGIGVARSDAEVAAHVVGDPISWALAPTVGYCYQPDGNGYPETIANLNTSGEPLHHTQGPATGEEAPYYSGTTMSGRVVVPPMGAVISVLDGQAQLSDVASLAMITATVFTTTGDVIVAEDSYEVSATHQITIVSELLDAYVGQDVDVKMSFSGSEVARPRITVTGV